MNHFHVYTIHNIKNNKMYVGLSRNVERRWLKHIRVASGKKTDCKYLVHKAISKYGINNFVFSIIQSFAMLKDCKNAEIYWIKYFKSKSRDFGYNLTGGGEGLFGFKHSEASKEKMRSKAIGRKLSQETIEILRIFNTGKIMSPESKKAIGDFHRGVPLSKEHREKISTARKGMIFTQEHCDNISKAQIGVRCGEKNPFFGKTHAKESLLKFSGENCKTSKLTSEQVIKIREKYSSGDYSQQKLADEYSVSRENIGNIVNYKRWKHI